MPRPVLIDRLTWLNRAGESLVSKPTDQVQTCQGGRRARRVAGSVACQRRSTRRTRRRRDHPRRIRRRQRRRKRFRLHGPPRRGRRPRPQRRRSAIVRAAAFSKSLSAVVGGCGLSTQRRRPSATCRLPRRRLPVAVIAAAAAVAPRRSRVSGRRRQKTRFERHVDGRRQSKQDFAPRQSLESRNQSALRFLARGRRRPSM